jgi:putative hydrolase
VDIPDGGTLDLDDATLELDLVVISVRSKLTMDGKAMNRRVVRAVRHPQRKPVAECTLTFPHECRVSGGWRRQWHTRSS